MDRFCEWHGVWECLRCMPPDEYFRWRVRNDPTLSYGWGVFYGDHSRQARVFPADKGGAA